MKKLDWTTKVIIICTIIVGICLLYIELKKWKTHLRGLEVTEQKEEDMPMVS